MGLIRQVSGIFRRIYDALSSARGKEVLLFMLFLLISYVFWLLLTLNNEVQEDMDVPVELVDVPDSVTIITDVPQVIKVSVRDKGSSLMKYRMGGTKVMKINWGDYILTDNKFLVSRADLSSRVRDYCGTGSQVVTVSPDSLRLNYTTSPGRRVVVKVVADLQPSFGNIISGPICTNVDSVLLYSVKDLPHSLVSVETVPIVRGGLTDTTVITARIEPIAGVKMVPDQVTVTVPVEPLIARKQYAPVIVKNMPSDMGMITFPSRIEVSYLVPMSMYNDELYDVNAYVDYNDVRRSVNGKLPVTLSLLPEFYHNTEMSPDSVEYIIEQRHQP